MRKYLIEKILPNIIAICLVSSLAYLLLLIRSPDSISDEFISNLIAASAITLLLVVGFSFIKFTRHRSFLSSLLALGFRDVFSSRDELTAHISLNHIFNNIRSNSDLFIAARSALTWSLDYQNLEKIINEKNIKVTFVIADPNLNMDNSPIKDDHGKDDIIGSLKRLNRIQVQSGSIGNLRIYLIPTFLLSSFVFYEDTKKGETGVLEFGADMSSDERPTIILNEGYFLKYIKKIYWKITEKRDPIDNLSSYLKMFD